MERLGLVGLPNAGKSALFNALTGGAATVAAHPFSTTESHIGVAQVPDARLEALAEMSRSRKVVPATVELVDIAGLVAGSSTGEGLGNRFLGGIREVDAILAVLRAFEDDNVVGATDPIDDLHTLELELVLADVDSVETQLPRRRKMARMAGAGTGRAGMDSSLAAEVAVLEAALAVLEEGTPLYRSSLSPEQRAALRPMFLLTNKALLVVVNLGEDQLAGAGTEGAGMADADRLVKGPSGPTERVVQAVADDLGAAAEVLGVSVQLESETAELEPAERAELLEGLGLGEGALPRVARAAHNLLGLRTFLTTGDKESRAWTFRAGAHAPECAGVIHSDLQRGFIRAEVIRWDALLELGSWAAAKDAGQLRVEGKDYEVADGDVLEIRFNV